MKFTKVFEEEGLNYRSLITREAVRAGILVRMGFCWCVRIGVIINSREAVLKGMKIAMRRYYAKWQKKRDTYMQP